MRQHLKITQAVEQLSGRAALERVDVGERMRRLADLIIACALLFLTFPLMAFVALAIKCEGPGAIFARQERRSSDGRRFNLFTFRTTQHDPENVRPVWARQPTRIGEVLRFTRIDASRSSSTCFAGRSA